MEFTSHVKQLIEKHCYAFSSDTCGDKNVVEDNSAASQISSEVSKNVAKEELPESDDKKEVRGIEFVDVSDTNSRESLEECKVSLDKDFLIEDKGVAVGPLNEEEVVPKQLLLDCQREYKKKIQSLQISITNIVRATDKDALKLRAKFLEEKIEALETRLKEKEAKPQSGVVLREGFVVIDTRDKEGFDTVKSLQAINKDLYQRLNTAIQEKKLLEDRLETQLNASRIENENLHHQMTTFVQQKKDLNNRLIELRVILDAKESECRESERRCSVLTRELESCTKKYIAQNTKLSKECLDLDVVEKWLADTLKSQSHLKKQLAMLNEDLRRMGEGQLICEVRKTLDTPRRWSAKRIHGLEKRTRHFYVTERGELFEDYDNKSKEIGLELDLLRENVMMLRSALGQKAEQCSLLEEELKIFRGELGPREVKLEEVKVEGNCGVVEISPQH